METASAPAAVAAQRVRDRLGVDVRDALLQREHVAAQQA
jgi:hypothetical protein